MLNTGTNVINSASIIAKKQKRELLSWLQVLWEDFFALRQQVFLAEALSVDFEAVFLHSDLRVVDEILLILLMIKV